MIDTVRFKISPIGNTVKDYLKRLSKVSYFTDANGETSQSVYGVMAIPPYEYEMNYFLDRYRKDVLYLEGSLPKIWYGENVSLLYEEQLEPVLKMIYEKFVVTIGNFPDYHSWVVQRLDTTYAWKLQSEEEAIQFLEYAEGLTLPRNSKHYYGVHETVVFGSKKSKTLTFYRKYPEFVAKDQVLLLKKGFKEKVLDTNSLAEGVVRFEIMNRTDSLKAFIKPDGPLTIDRFFEKGIIAELLMSNLKKLQGTINTSLKEDRLVMQKLKERYKRNIALRLFGFYKAYYSKIDTNRLIHQHCNSGDISKNKKELSEAGVNALTYLSSTKFDFSIPSPLVVNVPPSSAAIADELERNLAFIHGTYNYLDEKKIEVKIPSVEEIGL